MTGVVVVAQKAATLQGETSRAGYTCWLIRLAGCSLRCTYCDTAWARGAGKAESVSDLVSEAREAGLHHVLVTGGEPLEQESAVELLRGLVDAGLRAALETSGACPTAAVDPRVSIVLDVKCPGSGMADRMHWPNLERIRSQDEVKFVLTDRLDYEFAVQAIQRHDLLGRTTVLLSPVPGQLGTQVLARWMLADKLHAKLQVQLHKLAWPDLEEPRPALSRTESAANCRRTP